MFIARASTIRASVRGINALRGRNPTQQFGRRTYAAAYKSEKTDDLPWLLCSIGVAGLGLWYLYQPSPRKTGHDNDHHEDEQ